MSDEPKVYAVSYGNGNDGVSHMHPDFYCRTDKPYDLARLAIITNMTSDNGKAWASEQVDVDGEAEWTISAMLLDPPEYTADGDVDVSLCDDGSSWSESNGAWMIAEVFESDYEPNADDPWATPIHDGLDACFGADVVAKYADKGSV
jgi:hypothetical protein